MITESSSIAKGEVVTAGAVPTEAAAHGLSNKGTDHHDKHLSTDHLLADLKGRTTSGAAITIAAQVTKFVLNLTSIMVLARLLTPKDFGLVAMVATVMGYLAVFKDAGLST